MSKEEPKREEEIYLLISYNRENVTDSLTLYKTNKSEMMKVIIQHGGSFSFLNRPLHEDSEDNYEKELPYYLVVFD